MTSPPPSSPRLEHEEVVTPGQPTLLSARDDNIVESTIMEMSKPLSQVDLYGILARAPAAEFGERVLSARSKTVRRPNGKRKHSNNDTGTDEGLTEPRTKSDDRRYADRDPLGIEVEILKAQVKTDCVRIKTEAKAAQQALGVNTVRYAAILAKNDRLKNVDAEGVKKCELAHDLSPLCATAAVGAQQEQPDQRVHLVGHSKLQRKRGRRHPVGEKKKSQASVISAVANSEVGSLQHFAGKPSFERGSDLTLAELKSDVYSSNLHNGSSPCRGETECCCTSSNTCGSEGDAQRHGREAELCGIGDVELCYRGEKGEEQQTSDFTESASEYGDELFEPTDENIETAPVSSPQSSPPSPNPRIVKGMINEELHDGGRSVFEESSSVSERQNCCGAEQEGCGVADTASAVKIEACWRGFLGRCKAKCLLRSDLHKALRTLGGGRMSKVMSLGDIEEEDQRGLHRALQAATQSRLPLRHLPPQVPESTAVHIPHAHKSNRLNRR